MANILREFVDLKYDKNVIKEAKEKGLPVILTSILQRADAINQNNRVYPRTVLDRELNNYKKAISEGRATGELDHPEETVVSLVNVSHVIRDAWWDGNDIIGKIEILNTPKGKIAQELLEAGVRVGISSRGVGEVQKTNEGHDMVDETFMLIAFDLVSEPSTHNAWLHENKSVNIIDIKKMVPKVDRVNRIVNEILMRK